MVSCACNVLIYDSVHSIEMRLRRVEDLQGSFLVPGHTTDTRRRREGAGRARCLCAFVEMSNSCVRGVRRTCDIL